jgi:hypothetical protein
MKVLMGMNFTLFSTDKNIRYKLVLLPNNKNHDTLIICNC